MAGDDPATTFWAGFTRDPRDVTAAAMRVSDRDRAHLVTALGEAYADGRLDLAEHEDRVASAQAVKTFGEVLGLVDDLVPRTSVPVVSTRDELRRRAEAEWRGDLRSSLAGFGGIATLLLAIWLVTSVASGTLLFFWPMFPLFFVGANSVRAVLHRDEILDKRVRRYEREEERERRRLERGSDDR